VNMIGWSKAGFSRVLKGSYGSNSLSSALGTSASAFSVGLGASFNLPVELMERMSLP
jgi:hypothetical protein